MSKALIGCERSGIVRDAFIAVGVDAVSCDLADTERPGPHIKGDVLEALTTDFWDLFIVFPDCTYLTVSGIHWNNRGRGWDGTNAALNFVRKLLVAPVYRIALENPALNVINTNIRRPDQKIQPYQFGHDASKNTGLWLKNLPPLYPTRYVEPRIVEWNGKPAKRWANQCDSNQNKLGPSPTRAMDRARTYEGIANAMASQWGKLL